MTAGAPPPPARRGVVPAVAALLTALICAPLVGGHLLYRDAVAVPRSALTAAAFGIDGTAPRAVPQDALVAMLSRVVDGGLVVVALTALALFAAGVGYGRLAERLVPGAGTAGAAAATVLGIWNPFVAERLGQGQWSLLAGYAALGWTVCAVQDAADRPGPRTTAVLAAAFAAGGLTPTGSILVLAVAATAAVVATPGMRRTVIGMAVWAATASSWLVGAAASTQVASSGGAEVFALRGEPGLGVVGSALGLGGIWNADAVPASRTSPWAAVATVVFLGVVGVGAVRLLRRRPVSAMVCGLAVLAGLAVTVTVAAATPLGIVAMDTLLESVPGAGLFRDTHKYLALMVPFYAVAAAATVAAARKAVPAGFAAVAVCALIAAPLPDLAWGVGGRMTSVDYPDDYARVAALIDRVDDRRAVALWPATQTRRLSWTGGTSLTPLPRMLTAPTVVSGALTVDGTTVDAPTGRVADVVAALDAGGDPRRLAALGVGWVIVEEADPPSQLAASTPVFAGRHLLVYRIDGAVEPHRPGPVARGAAILAFGLWCGALVGGLVAATRRR